MINSVVTVATQLIQNSDSYFSGKEKSGTRYQLTERNILKLSGHNRYLPDDYVEALKLEMLQRDWLMFKIDSGAYAFLLMQQTNNWPRISVKYVLKSDDEDETE